MKRCSFHHSLRGYLYQRAFLRSLGTFNFVDIGLLNSGKFPFTISEGLVKYSQTGRRNRHVSSS
jgi:hypothetical protein